MKNKKNLESVSVPSSSFSAKILLAGNAVLDITPIFPVPTTDQVDFLDELIPGRLIQMNGVHVHAGGACCNTGAALRFFGYDVEIAAGIGYDAFGEILAGLVGKAGLRAKFAQIEGANTSYTVVLSPPGTDRIFLHDSGVGDLFDSSHVSQEAGKDCSLFHFGYPPLMRKMYENNGEETRRLFERYSTRGALTSLDMAMVSEDAHAASVDWKIILKRLLPQVDFFLPSLEEICFFIDPERYKQWKRRNGRAGGVPKDISVSQDIAPLAEQLLDLGAGIVIIKCGEYGIYYRTAGAKRLLPSAKKMGRSVDTLADRSGFVHAFQADRLVSANGAGDAAVAGFLAGMLEGYALEQSVMLAAASGACSVSAYDAVGTLLPIRDLMTRIQSGWPRGEKIRA